jgi:23S rRNA (cytosine1962-C5)-methyltransferase
VQSIYLKNGAQKKIAAGHPWIYSNQIDPKSWESGQPSPGDLVWIFDFRQKYLGTGFYSPHSMIAVRLVSRDRCEQVDEALIRKRVLDAVAYRDFFRRPDTDSYRLIFAESDLLPGVIADQFGDTIVLQILFFGMEKWTDLIASTLIEAVHPANLLLNNEEPVRKKEGLPLYRKILTGQEPSQAEILENGLRLRFDLATGQKTGYYLDQKANHGELRRFVKGKTVLDCFSYVGGFALNAAAGGASRVTAVDSSEAAIALGRQNAEINGLAGNMEWVVANVFDYLRSAIAGNLSYDVIILDPPAFAKSHAALEGARRGYKEINLSALRLLPAGGILATNSCSFHMPENVFVETVLEAARDARRTMRIMDVRRQDADHPVLAGYPESHYLKSLWLLILE